MRCFVVRRQSVDSRERSFRDWKRLLNTYYVHHNCRCVFDLKNNDNNKHTRQSTTTSKTRNSFNIFFILLSLLYRRARLQLAQTGRKKCPAATTTTTTRARACSILKCSRWPSTNHNTNKRPLRPTIHQTNHRTDLLVCHQFVINSSTNQSGQVWVSLENPICYFP